MSDIIGYIFMGVGAFLLSFSTYCYVYESDQKQFSDPANRFGAWGVVAICWMLIVAGHLL